MRIEELIESADRLCAGIDQAIQSANNEIKFCQETSLMLEQYSWESFKMMNDLKEIRCNLTGNNGIEQS